MGPSIESRIDNDFKYHAPKAGQPEKYEAIREEGRLLAHKLVKLTPAGREQALALTKLDEVVFWANAAIARNE